MHEVRADGLPFSGFEFERFRRAEVEQFQGDYVIDSPRLDEVLDIHARILGHYLPVFLAATAMPTPPRMMAVETRRRWVSTSCRKRTPARAVSTGTVSWTTAARIVPR